MDRLDQLEAQSIYIIREAYYHYKNIALLWSIGKDSTTLAWLCRKAFFGKIPFKALHIDTSYKFKEMYEFRDEYSKKWGFDLVVSRNEEAIAAGMNCAKKLECCTALKTEGLKQAIAKYGFEALLLGIRRDEHGVRAKERIFSPRNEQFQWNYQDQPPELWDQYKSQAEENTHVRVHPLLGWTELDIWEYIKREQIPITDLYFSKNGKRYRSIGCTTCCNPVESTASNVDEIIYELQHTNTSERAGRAQDKEDTYTMQKLRALGYM
ncbi:MAG: sulfate adenylyltransferase subunit 2 [Sedimentisphaerales bacterium]|nr:sulfate adenylyltransferase subunit 2 [Sedimentisphaerales bacterium]MBN2843546.1 sulfate adenylyltransferase subunit 2 [Sedimentisphaerales bacterium]